MEGQLGVIGSASDAYDYARSKRWGMMNRKHLASVVFAGGVTIITLCTLSAIPILMTEFSWPAVGIILAGVSGGVFCLIVSRLMKRLL